MFVIPDSESSRVGTFSNSTFRAPLAVPDLPIDIILPILAQLIDRTDWHTCCLVSKALNRITTPLLYQKLDSRIDSETILHPSSTILQRPELARYVRHVTETGTAHRGLLRDQENITENALKALALCVNLESMTWVDDSATTDFTFLSFLAVVRVHPLRELSIRTHSDLGNKVWSELITLRGLRKISIWCMDGPPRVLQGWSESLGDTLTHLELGRCTGVPPTIIISVLLQLRELRDLRLRGAPAHTISTILSHLVHLHSLDTEYPGSYVSRPPGVGNTPPSNFSTLRKLTVRTSAINEFGPQALWGWTLSIIPNPGLESLDQRAFTIYSGYVEVPRIFILDLARIHGSTLKHFSVGEAQLMLGDIACLCTNFPHLETLVCATASPDIESIIESIAAAKNLRTLSLQVQWIRSGRKDAQQFTSQHARDLMLRTEDSQLRDIAIGPTIYKGKWVLKEPKEDVQEGEVEFQVLADAAIARWQI